MLIARCDAVTARQKVRRVERRGNPSLLKSKAYGDDGFSPNSRGGTCGASPVESAKLPTTEKARQPQVGPEPPHQAVELHVLQAVCREAQMVGEVKRDLPAALGNPDRETRDRSSAGKAVGRNRTPRWRAPSRGQLAPCLSHRNAQSAEIEIDLQADLPARQRQLGALLVAQRDRLRPDDDGAAAAGGAVEAGNVIGTAD